MCLLRLPPRCEQGGLKGAKKPEFKEDYSVEKSKGFGKKGRGRQATGRRSQGEKEGQVSHHENLYEVGVDPEDCIEQRQQFAWRFQEGRAEYVCYHLYDQSTRHASGTSSTLGGLPT